ncbi:MAG TPA: LysR family transcriptional regulator [Mariprofundaceae bacterium]|nr:LysR family transcriptional regulator [Mariprofundaceae bacterium]
MKDRLNSMRVFAQVVEAKSFSAAADRLHISKSLASRHVSALEKALDVKLLNRSTRRLSLTEAGAQFYEHCARIVQEAELAEQALTRIQTEPAGLVKVTATPAFAVRHVLPKLPGFYQRYPKIRVQVSCSNQSVDLGETGFDFGIRVAFDPPANLIVRKLAANRSVLCAAPDYIRLHGMPRRIEELSQHDCVQFSPLAPKGTWTFRRDRRKYSVAVSGTFATDEMDAVRTAVIAGLGIGILPAYMAGDDLRKGELVPLLRQYQVVPESAIYLVYLPNHTLPSRVRALIDYLVDQFRKAPPWEAGW